MPVKNLLRTLLAGLLAAAFLIPSTASAEECSPSAFMLDDIQGVYAAPNILMSVFPCGGVAIRTGVDGDLRWASGYYPRSRLPDGTIILYMVPTPTGSGGLIYNDVRFDALAMTPDVPGVMRLWSVTGANQWFDMYLDKISDTI